MLIGSTWQWHAKSRLDKSILPAFRHPQWNWHRIYRFSKPDHFADRDQVLAVARISEAKTRGISHNGFIGRRLHAHSDDSRAQPGYRFARLGCAAELPNSARSGGRTFRSPRSFAVTALVAVQRGVPPAPARLVLRSGPPSPARARRCARPRTR